MENDKKIKWNFRPHSGKEYRQNVKDQPIKSGDLPKLTKLARETIQNSVDATIGVETNVKFTLVTDTNANDSVKKTLAQIINHLKFAGADDKERLNKNIQKYFNDDSVNIDNIGSKKIPYLIIEDFRTTGLIGFIDKRLNNADISDEYSKLNTLYSFLGQIGGNSKPLGTTGGGTWGLGKATIPQSSLLNTYFVYSNREGTENLKTKIKDISEELCEPISVLGGSAGLPLLFRPEIETRENTRIEGEVQLGEDDGGLTTPYMDKQIINEWLANVPYMKRTTEAGTSVVIPFPLNNKSEDLTKEDDPLKEIYSAIEEHYYYLIFAHLAKNPDIKDKLSCEFWVNDNEIEEYRLNGNLLEQKNRNLLLKLETEKTLSNDEYGYLFRHQLHKFYMLSEIDDDAHRFEIPIKLDKSFYNKQRNELTQSIDEAIALEIETARNLWTGSLNSGQTTQANDVLFVFKLFIGNEVFGNIDLQLIAYDKNKKSLLTICQKAEQKYKQFILRNFTLLTHASEGMVNLPPEFGYFIRIKPKKDKENDYEDMTRILATIEDPTHTNFRRSNIEPDDNNEMIDFVGKYSTDIFLRARYAYNYTITSFLEKLTYIIPEEEEDAFSDPIFQLRDEEIEDVRSRGGRRSSVISKKDPLTPTIEIDQSQGVNYEIIYDKNRIRKKFLITRRMKNTKHPSALESLTVWYGIKKSRNNSDKNFLPLITSYRLEDLKNSFTPDNHPSIEDFIIKDLNNKSIRQEIEIIINSDYAEQDLNIEIELPEVTQVPPDLQEFWAIGGNIIKTEEADE